MKYLSVFQLLVLLVALMPLAAPAQPAGAGIPVADFYRQPQFGVAALNPGADGATHVAFLREVKGRQSLLVMDLASKEIKNVAGFDTADVERFVWINERRLLYWVGDFRSGMGNSDKQGIYAIDRDGSRPFTLNEGLVSRGGMVGSGSRGIPARADFYSRATGNSDDFVVAQYSTSPMRATLLRVNSRDGARTPIESGGLDNVLEWAMDGDDVPRAALAYDRDRRALFVREKAGAAWRKVGDWSIDDPSIIRPMAFNKAGELFVAMRAAGADHMAVHRFDWATGVPDAQPLVSVKGFDIDIASRWAELRVIPRLIFDPRDAATLVGVRYEAEVEGTHWLKADFKSAQDLIDNTLKGKVNELSGLPDKTMLVRSVGDASPLRYYLFDGKARKLSLLGASRPWLDEKQLSATDFIRYPARDGLSIPAYLTLPRGVEPKALPLVVLVHGGPYLRGNNWGWYRDRQFLASRGYAVLEPEFRGSLGFGWKLHRAGWKQWGLAMQDDIADGVAEMVKRGIVDRNRVCIAGASYGGYATVMGLVKHPDVYKCGISWVGVTDIELMYTVGWGDIAGSEWAAFSMPLMVADREKDAQQIRATSAVHQAARLKAPVILAYGREDVRVPYDHGQKLRDALKPHNKNVEYIEYPGEGHGWRLLETNIDFWTRAEKLLAQTIGPAR